MPWRTMICLLPTLLFLGARCSALPPATQAAPKLVFAHYMVAFAAYGPTVAGYQREIREAQAAGIDGFALNVGAWSKEPRYVQRSAMIYQAAQELGTGFKLFFSMDQHVLQDLDDLKQIVRTYARHPNQLTRGGRVVVSTFGGGRVAWREKVLEPLHAEGIDLFFVPFFYSQPRASELPDLDTARGVVSDHADVVDGLFFFGAAGTPEQLAQCNANYAVALRERGKLFMAGVSPFYWGSHQPGRRYFETRGGEGLAVQWEKIIEVQPEWVEIVTWNDFAESYLCPAADPGQFLQEIRAPVRPCHAAYLEMCKPYIAWFKTGVKPPIDRDAVFYVYRLHPRGAVASNGAAPATGTVHAATSAAVAATNKATQPGAAKPRAVLTEPVTQLHGEVRDDLYLTVALTAPAELHVDSGGTASVHSLPPGTTHLQVVFHPGAQRFELLRGGKKVITLDGEPIDATPEWYDFFPATGFGYGR